MLDSVLNQDESREKMVWNDFFEKTPYKEKRKSLLAKKTEESTEKSELTWKQIKVIINGHFEGQKETKETQLPIVLNPLSYLHVVRARKNPSRVSQANVYTSFECSIILRAL